MFPLAWPFPGAGDAALIGVILLAGWLIWQCLPK